MPTSVREQVLSALFDVLTAALQPGVKVERNRNAEVAAWPTLVMIDGGQSTEYELSGFARHDMEVTLEAHVQAATDQALGPALNDLLARAVKALCDAEKAGAFGDLVADLREGDLGVEIARGAPETPTASFSQAMQVQYWTAAGDPYQLATP